MGKYIIVLSFMCMITCAFGQKKPLGFSDQDSTSKIESVQISSNGKFVVYTCNISESTSSLIIEAFDGSWRREIPNGGGAVFTDDSKNMVFKKSSDTIGILDIETNALSVIPKATSFKIPKTGNDQWLAYLTNNFNHELVLYNLFTKGKKVYPFVAEYQFSDNGKVLLLQTIIKKDTGSLYSLLWIDLVNGTEKIVKQGINKAQNICFDDSAGKLAFIVNGKSTTLWIYKQDSDSASILADDNMAGFDAKFKIGDCYGFPKFSKNGKKVYFSLRLTKVSKDKKSVNLDIWSYQDPKLQSEQQRELKTGDRCFTAVINEFDNKIIPLENEDDWGGIQLAEGGNGEYALVKQLKGSYNEGNWNLSSRPSVCLVSTIDGHRELILRNAFIQGNEPVFSPHGQYLIWFDPVVRQYFTYSLQDAQIRCISKSISWSLYDPEHDLPGNPFSFGFGTNIWLENDAAVFLYDKFDIWQVDPQAGKLPINITGGFGRKNNISLRYLSFNKNQNQELSIAPGQKLLLAGFNHQNKYNGFFQKELGKEGKPTELTMGPYIYYFPVAEIHVNSFLPQKAKYNDSYIVQRMSAGSPPNLYSTKDFVSFIPLTNYEPRSSSMTAELLRWVLPGGQHAEGVLYKPANFDPNKKYPVIFYLYEKDADGLNRFIYPVLSGGRLEIPYFVSNGYLVFDPNVYFKIGEPGESAYRSVMSAAKCLFKNSWVDSTKVGIQGHSFGGYEVNYIITRTNLFKAACSAAGPTDFVSFYNAIRPSNGGSSQYLFETFQNRIGKTLWEKPQSYTDNSPLFKANKVNTPLLIMHNEADQSVPFSQGIEWFVGLRRLGKKVWMLQYDEEGHALNQKQNKRDFSIRLGQFFDHLLKDAPAPQWMVESIPAKLKGIESGLELRLPK